MDVPGLHGSRLATLAPGMAPWAMQIEDSALAQEPTKARTKWLRKQSSIPEGPSSYGLGPPKSPLRGLEAHENALMGAGALSITLQRKARGGIVSLD